MNSKTDKKLEDLIGKALKEMPMESPSLNFTAKVMGQIETPPKNSMFEYTPLIPRYLWVVLGFGVVSVFVFLFFNGIGIGMEYDGLPNFDISGLSEIRLFDGLSRIKLANTLVYGVVGFTFFTCLQILLIKRRFDKRFSPS